MTRHAEEVLGNPAPIGLMGLAIGCGALAPAELGLTQLDDARVWLWIMLAGGVLQIYAGIIDLVNRNVLGATAFTVYGILWLIAGVQVGGAVTGDPMVKVYLYAVFLLFTLYMMVGFMTVSLNLTLVFAEFVAIFALEIAAGIQPALHAKTTPIVGVLHAVAAFQVVWAAAGGVLNNLLGRNLFLQGEPPLRRSESWLESHDFQSLRHHADLRERIVHALYEFWERHAWDWISAMEVCKRLGIEQQALAPDFWYLHQKSYVDLQKDASGEPAEPKMVRLSAAGVDYYGELQQRKHRF
jgi:succinate-acetate transporter protein